MLVPHAVALAVTPAGGNAHKGRGRPQRFALVEQGLFVACQIQHARLGNAHGPAKALAQEVDARPKELAGDVVVVSHGVPGFGSVAVFAAQDDPVGEADVILRVELLLVVVAGGVQRVGIAGAGGQFRERHGAGHGAGGVQRVNNPGQLPCHHGQAARVGLAHVVEALGQGLVGIVVAQHLPEQRGHIGVIGVVNLIADGPQHDGGVIPVALHHALQVGAVPLGEVLGIAVALGGIDIVALPPLVLGALPLVEGLVHHQQAQLVAQIQQMGVRRIVGGAQGVASGGLELLKPPPPDLLGRCRTQCARVMMDAHAAELHVFAIEEEALVGVEADGTDAHKQLPFIGNPAILQHLAHQRVQRGALRAPQRGMGHPQGAFAMSALGGGLRGNAVVQHQREVRALSAQGFVLHADRCRAVRFHLLGGHEDAVVCKAHGVADFQGYVAVDTAAGKPAGIRHLVMLHADADHVLPGANKRAHIIGEGGVAIGAGAQVVAVAPHPGMLVYATEGDAHPLARSLLRQEEVLAVPGGAAGQIPGAAGVVPVKGMLHRPVVGQGYLPPGAVVIAHEIRAGLVPQVKAPVQVQLCHISHGCPPMFAQCA